VYVGTTIFSQLMQHLPWHRFYPIVRRYESNHNIRFISTYLLIAIVRKRLRIDLPLYTILQILSVSLFEKSPLLQVLTDFDYTFDNPGFPNQLTLFD